MNFETHWLGLTAYDKSQELQQVWAERARAEDEIHVLGLEHEGVVTLGKRASRAEDLLWDEEELQTRRLEVRKIDRGGQATLHSRGQLVIYPILPLVKMNLGVRAYVELLMDTTSELLRRHGIENWGGEEPGLHTSRGKIAFCGIRVERGATRHGISLNVRNDLSLFDGIRSCGFMRARLDSMENHGVSADLEALFREWVEIFHNRAFSRFSHGV